MNKFSERMREQLKVAEENKVEWKRQPEILLCPNTPKPLHGVVPRVILGATWWNRTREEAYRSTNYHCIACGVHKFYAKSRKWLEGHELYDIDYRKGTSTYIKTVPLCHFCHNYIHDGRLLRLLQKGEIHHAKYVAIIQHGDKILAAAGLCKSSKPDRDAEVKKLEKKGLIAPWHKWRLILNGKVYKTPYKDETAWREAHDAS